ncbi:serine hydrolase domain-containing protein [Arsenicibacter rosenii]|nr:serine hydrolase domain-containing protein [Arsenicibacter rosenii]
MKKTYLLSLFVLISMTTLAQNAALDSLTRLSRRYYNDQQPDLLYGLMGEGFQKQIASDQLRQTTQMLRMQLGDWQKADYKNTTNGVAKYEATFAKAVLDFYISRDSKGKIETFLFRPHQAEVQKAAVLPVSNPMRTALDKQVDSLARRYFAGQNGAGMSIGVVRNDSVFMYHYGETTKGSGQLPAANTIYEIGSVSKTFTATMLADAVRRGLVKLTDPVSNYLPASIPVLQKGGKPVTLLQLANHTSGLPRLPDNLFTANASETNPYKHYDRDALFSYLKSAKLNSAGTYEYSNLGAGLLGTVLEIVNKQPYEQMLTAEIGKPLGLAQTKLNLTSEDIRQFAQGHDAEGHAVSSWEFQALAGAGGIRSTLSDMLLYVKAELAKGDTPLSKDMQLTQQITFTNKQIVGLGWHKTRDGWFWHNGQTGGYSSFAGFEPTKKMAVVVLTNSAAELDPTSFALLRRLTK